MKAVSIVDYGVGNLKSIRMALNHCGADVRLGSTPGFILSADRLVFPGVGAFANAMQRLQEMELDGAIREYARLGRPFLGICLGMQMMFDESDEFGTTAGLGLVPGKVTRIPSTDSNGVPHVVPHIGWEGLERVPSGSDWEDTLLEGTAEGTAMYFVHSYVGIPESSAHHLAQCRYNGHALCAAIRSDHIYGTQFHPEKSGEAGLRLLQRFINT